MTNQEFFTKCVTHVLNQTERSAQGGSCLYAGPNGNSCAIGVFLPRDLAKKADKGEATDIFEVLRRHSKIAEILDDVDIHLMRKCQRVHDEVHDRDEDGLWELRKYYRLIAKEFGLEMPSGV